MLIYKKKTEYEITASKVGSKIGKKKRDPENSGERLKVGSNLEVHSDSPDTGGDPANSGERLEVRINL